MLASCLNPPARACQGDNECELDERQGQCLEPGYCAYQDDACPSGEVFGPFAGQGLAGRCVEDQGQATSGSSGGQGSTSSSGPSTEGAGSEFESESGSESDGNPAVSVVEVKRWTTEGAVTLADLAARNGRVAVLGTAQSSQDALALTVCDGSDTAWALAADAIVDARGDTVVLSDAGEVWVAGNRTVSGDGSGRPFVARVAADGALAWIHSWDTLGLDELVGAGVDDNGVVTVAGRLDDAPWLARLDADGALLHSQQWIFGVDGVLPSVVDVTAGGLTVIAGASDPRDTWGLRFVAPSGAALLRVSVPDDATRTVAHLIASPSALVLGGGSDSWLMQADYQGAVQWSTETPTGRALGIAVDIDGRIAVVGDAEPGVAVWRFEADGTSMTTADITDAPSAGAAIAADGLALLVAAAFENEVVLWRVEP